MFWPRQPALCLTSPTLPLIHRNYLWVCQATVCRYVTVWCSTVHHHPWVLTIDYEMFDLLYQMPLLTVGKPPSVAQMLESTEGFICFGSISFWDEFKKTTTTRILDNLCGCASFCMLCVLAENKIIFTVSLGNVTICNHTIAKFLSFFSLSFTYLVSSVVQNATCSNA